MQDENQKPIAQNVLAFVLDQILRLLHPFVPFITEGIFKKLNEIAPVRKLKGLVEAEGAKALVIAKWPGKLSSLIEEGTDNRISREQSVVRATRDIRSKYDIPSSTVLGTSVRAPAEYADDLNKDAEWISYLARIKQFAAGPHIVKPKNAATTIVNDMQIYVHDVIDPEAERRRLEKQKDEIEKAQKAVEAKLGNENFVTKAKPEVVAQARKKLAGLSEQLNTVEKHLSEL